jgi:hypothetical protein
MIDEQKNSIFNWNINKIIRLLTVYTAKIFPRWEFCRTPDEMSGMVTGVLLFLSDKTSKNVLFLEFFVLQCRKYTLKE